LQALKKKARDDRRRGLFLVLDFSFGAFCRPALNIEKLSPSGIR
jgi:hypothetical protein